MISQSDRISVNNKSRVLHVLVKPRRTKHISDTRPIKNVGLFFQSLYNRSFIHNLPKSKSQNSINILKLESLGIPNFAVISENSIRGESLSSRKNRKYLKHMKKCGINTIIDLRDKYRSQSFPELCSKNGLKYFSIPVDSSSVSDKDIIKNLPLLFQLMDDGHFYMACAQGLHRTDIALSLNYVFNPKSSKPPVLRGHFRDGALKFDDIARRLNSIKKNLTLDDLKNWGWGEDFEQQFAKRKKQLVSYNNAYYSQTL